MHGTPAKSIEGGVPTTTHKWIVDKFESEALTLSPANQATVWSASEKAIGEIYLCEFKIFKFLAFAAM